MRRHLASGLGLVVCVVAVTTAAQRLSFFKAVETVLTDQPITSAATADLDSDGLVDLVVATPSEGTIHVALGFRRGEFRAPESYAVSRGTGHLTLADFNNDGVIDIGVDVFGIGVLLGHGDGTFQAPIVTRGSAKDVVVADFDGDGIDDVASVGKNSISIIPDTIDIYSGLGNGSFGPPHTLFSSDRSPHALSVGDFNGDGRPDLVFAETENRSLYLYLNRGALAFALTELVAPIEPGRALTAVADIDGNGTDDVVTASGFGVVSIFPGDGTGRLQARRNYFAGATPCGQSACAEIRSLRLTDLDGDGLVDAIAAIHDPGSVAMLLNTGGGSFIGPGALNVPGFAEHVLVGDVDGDLTLDVVVIHSDAASVIDPGVRVVSAFLSKAHDKAKAKQRELE